jgi:CRP/FNR family transcriptional regulator, cyclic AMP receptor protein
MNRVLHKGEILFRQGESGSLFRLHQGLLKVVRVQEDGSQLLFNLIVPGELFPHHSLVTAKPYHGTAIAVLESVVERVPAHEWYESLERDPMIYREIAINLQDKLRMMQQRIDQLAAVSAASRLARLRDWFSAQFPDVLLHEVLTPEEISQLVGLRRETVNRWLKNQATTGL